MNKTMKKTVSVVLAGAFMFSCGAFAFAANETSAPTSIPAVIEDAPQLTLSQALGTISAVATEGDTTTVEVKFTDRDETMIFYIAPETYLIDAATGQPLALDALKDGAKVSVYYGPAVTMSLPAKSNATAIIVDTAQDGKLPLYAKVEAVSAKDNGDIQITTDGGSRLVTLPKDMAIAPFKTKNIVTTGDVVKDAEVLLWYDIMTLSMPAQATAQKAVLLSVPAPEAAEGTAAEAKTDEAVVPIGEVSEPANKIIVTTQAGVTSVNGQELQVSLYTNADGQAMLPVRAIAEALGYEVLWDNGTVTLKVKDGNRSVTYTVGSTNYGINRMLLQLDAAPENRDGVTYVPVAFFEQALDASVTINDANV